MRSYHLQGQQAACVFYGLDKVAFVNPHLLGAAVGAGVGALTAQDGERLQGAALGAVPGYMLGGLGARKPPTTPHVAPSPNQTIVPQTGTASWGAPAALPKMANLRFSGKVGPLSIGTEDKDVRLPGMHHWVPNRLVERAFEGVENGVPDQTLIDEAASSGWLPHAAIGAVTGLYAGHKLHGHLKHGPGDLKKDLLTAGVLGALGGFGLHRSGADDRRSDMAQSLKGARKEMSTASEAVPMTLSTGHGA